jgi:hypothetical protein
VKAGEKIIADDGTIWGEFVRDWPAGQPLTAGMVMRADGTTPTPMTKLEPEVVQFLNRRQKELRDRRDRRAG